MCGRATDKLFRKLKSVKDLVANGLKQCTLEFEREIWLYLLPFLIPLLSAFQKIYVCQL